MNWWLLHFIGGNNTYWIHSCEYNFWHHCSCVFPLLNYFSLSSTPHILNKMFHVFCCLCQIHGMTCSLPTILSSFHFVILLHAYTRHQPVIITHAFITTNSLRFHKELGVIAIFKVTAFSDRTRIIVSYIEPHGEVHCYQNDASNNWDTIVDEHSNVASQSSLPKCVSFVILSSIVVVWGLYV